jgi:asparaginyl-tRNA synthetase
VDHFGRSAYLSQSGQLYSEAGIFAHGRVYDFGPTFRAEKSKTRRHLNEFWMMDAEMAFMGLEESMQLQEDLIVYIVKKVLAECTVELDVLGRDVEKLKNVIGPFPRILHSEAIKMLKEANQNIGYDDDLGAEHETILSEKYSTPIFVTRYPAGVKAFYMRRDPEDNDRALCADMLAPEGYGEIIGGSERETDYDTLVERIKEHNLPLEQFQWYLDLRKFGSVPHSGFGYGLERLVTWICGIKHIREAIPFPRTLTRLEP